MSKIDENKKDNMELERNINAYFKRKIQGGSKEYKKHYFKKRKYEVSMDDDLIDSSVPYVIENFFNGPLSENDILFTEQLFDNYALFLAYKNLSEKQKLVVYLKYIFELSEQIIASKLGISQQAVSKRNQRALKILLSNRTY